MTDRGLSGCTREPNGVQGQTGLGGDEGMQSRGGVGGLTGRCGDMGLEGRSAAGDSAQYRAGGGEA